VIHSTEFMVDGSVARQRGFIRIHLESELKAIDALVLKLLNK